MRCPERKRHVFLLSPALLTINRKKKKQPFRRHPRSFAEIAHDVAANTHAIAQCLMRLSERAICGKSFPSNLSSLLTRSSFLFLVLSLSLSILPTTALSLSPYSLSPFRARALCTVCTGFSFSHTPSRYLSIYLSITCCLPILCIQDLCGSLLSPSFSFLRVFLFPSLFLCRINLCAYLCACVCLLFCNTD